MTPDHTFGILLKPDEYGAGDLIHNRAPGSYLRGSDRQQGIVAATRHHLKKMNYHNFHDLLHAFRFYDKVSLKVTIKNDLKTSRPKTSHDINML